METSKSGCPSSSSSSNLKRRKVGSRSLLACNNQRDWSGLPTDIVLAIMHRFTLIEDYVRFGAVCIPWRTIFLQQISSGRPSYCRLPYLLIVPPPPLEDHARLLYNPSTKRVYNFRLPVPHNKLCRGSSFGWLVTLEGLVHHPDFKMELHNPFLNRTIHLPPPCNILPPPGPKNPNTAPHPVEWDGYDVWRAVLSCDPHHSPDAFVCMAIMGRHRRFLAFFKPGNTHWTPISRTGDSYQPFTDVIFYHKTAQFYALLSDATLLAVDFLGDEGGNPRFMQVAAPRPSFAAFQMYLTEDLSTGDLFMVCQEQCNTVPDEEIRSTMLHYFRHVTTTGEIPEDNGPDTFTVKFDVFKLDATRGIWTQVNDIGNNIMFLGSNGSTLRAASDCPGCEPNCIYYTSDQFRDSFKKYGPPYDGVYNLDDGMLQPHYTASSTLIMRKRKAVESLERSTKVLPHAIWLEPTINV